MTEGVEVEFIGIFRKAYGNRKVSLSLKKSERLRDVIQRIVESSTELKRVLIDPELGSPLPNSVILVNGREIGVLKGLETEVGNGDKIAFIPVIHGG